jgi:2-hydroxychromene-2-carboxylate isomerase
MRPAIDFYFDFISPFSYFAHQRLPELADRFGYELSFQVVDLAELKRLAGNFGPTTREIPIKLRYMKVDQVRWARRYDVSVRTPAHYDSSIINRGTFFALTREMVRDYVTLTYRKVWGEGGHMTDEGLTRGIARELGWNDDEFLASANSSGADEQYRSSTARAHRRGVFGVPTMMVGNDMWWGNDRLQFLEEYLASGNVSTTGAVG